MPPATAAAPAPAAAPERQAPPPASLAARPAGDPPVPAPPKVSSVPPGRPAPKVADPVAAPTAPVTRTQPSSADRALSAAADEGPTDRARPPAPTRVLGAVQVAPGPRVVVHVDRAWFRRDPDGITRLVGRLRDAGAGSIEVVDVDVRIGRDQIRFYFDEDRADADRLSTAIARSDPADSAAARTPDVRDFTSYRPLPRAGTIEVWMASVTGNAALN